MTSDVNQRLIPVARDESIFVTPTGLLPKRLMQADDELFQVLDEVTELSRVADSELPDVAALSRTLRRAVSCVARQALLERELRSLALFDDLTGLHNRRAFWTLASQEVESAVQNQCKLLIFFADIDSLKQVNDAYGHQEGDLAIIRIARALQQTFRASDIIARLGGDEFAAIAVEAEEQHETSILSRLGSSLRMLHAKERRYELSLSVGSARFDPGKPVPLSELMRQADRSMYGQKRNRSDYAEASAG